MPQIAEKYARQIRRGQPIPYAGLEFYPLTVEQYALFSAARPAFELMQASLSPKFARLSWCACLDAMDEEILNSNGTRGTFLHTMLLVLAAALKLKAVPAAYGGEAAYTIRELRDRETNKLAAVMIGNPSENPVLLNMGDFDEIRQIIAAQNGYEIPDECWNPELVRAQQYMSSQKTNGYVFDMDDLVASVASASGVPMSAVWDWSIRDFQRIQAAIDRRLHFNIYTQAEMSGIIKFKYGNPYPSWKFDKKGDLPAGFTSTAELDAGANGLLGSPTQQFSE